MVGVLTVHTSASPFPFAAVATATYTDKAEVNFNEGNTGISLELNGTTLTDEGEIVRALAKAGGLAEDSAKVSRTFFILITDSYMFHSRKHSSSLLKSCLRPRPSQSSSLVLTLWTIT